MASPAHDYSHVQSDWCGNSNCNCGRYQPFQQPPTPVYPPYRGAYRSRMEEWSYPRKRHPAFAKTTKAKSSLGRKSRTQSTSTEQQEQPVAVPADSATIPSGVVAGEKLDYKTLKKRDNRAAIVNAYSGYIKDTVSESDFFAAVRKFALAKVS